MSPDFALGQWLGWCIVWPCKSYVSDGEREPPLKNQEEKLFSALFMDMFDTPMRKVSADLISHFLLSYFELELDVNDV